MAAKVKARLKPINFDNNECEIDSAFSLFPMLPKELRSAIWRHALERNRIIKILIEARADVVRWRLEERRKHQNDAYPGQGSVIEGESYHAIVNGCQALSKLLHINQESRAETLRFYRVQIPCAFRAANGQDHVSGILHINPEFDFLQLSPTWPIKDTLIAFLYHLKRFRDPRHVGIINLAIDYNGLRGHDIDSLVASDLDGDVRLAVADILSNMHEVFFVSSVRVGRQVLGWKSGFGSTGYLYNRSFPVHAIPPTFERLSYDPRAIRNDLKKVYADMGDPRQMVHQWNYILAKFDVTAQQTKYRFLLTFDPTIDSDPIMNKQGAEQWIKKEDRRWQTESEGRAQNENLEDSVRPVFGFWLFTLEALDSSFTYDSTSLRMMDMTEHAPELGCIDLY